MFKHLNNEINLICPRCESTNIYIGQNMEIDPKKIVRCNDCHYSDLSYKFTNEYKIDNSKDKKSNKHTYVE